MRTSTNASRDTRSSQQQRQRRQARPARHIYAYTHMRPRIRFVLGTRARNARARDICARHDIDAVTMMHVCIHACVSTGNLLSAVSVLLLLVACSEPKWAYDTVNSVDIGLWFLAVRLLACVRVCVCALCASSVSLRLRAKQAWSLFLPWACTIKHTQPLSSLTILRSPPTLQRPLHTL